MRECQECSTDLDREEREFRRLWRRIYAAYRCYRHAFERGCGRETMAYWVSRGGDRELASAVRWAIEEAVARGWIRRWAPSVSGYRRYSMRREPVAIPVETMNEADRLTRWRAEYLRCRAVQLLEEGGARIAVVRGRLPVSKVDGPQHETFEETLG